MYDLATAKTRLAIAGNTQDALVQSVLDTALELAEVYCSRKFMYAAEVASFYYKLGHTVQLTRYPLEQIVSVVHKGSGVSVDSSSFKAHHASGVIIFSGGVVSSQLDITYAGGYKILPASLELALFQIFDAVWASTPGGGKAAGVASVAGGSIKSISSPDIGSISYFDPNAGSGGGGGSAFGGLMPASAAQILDLYKLETC